MVVLLWIINQFQRIINYKLEKLIIGSLNKDKKSIIEIKNFDCSGGSGCYDLGYIITQIIYKLGEDEFIKIYNQISEENKKGFESLIRVGLEYGDNDYNGEMDNMTIKKEFPKLSKIIR